MAGKLHFSLVSPERQLFSGDRFGSGLHAVTVARTDAPLDEVMRTIKQALKDC